MQSSEIQLLLTISEDCTAFRASFRQIRTRFFLLPGAKALALQAAHIAAGGRAALTRACIYIDPNAYWPAERPGMALCAAPSRCFRVGNALFSCFFPAF